MKPTIRLPCAVEINTKLLNLDTRKPLDLSGAAHIVVSQTEDGKLTELVISIPELGKVLTVVPR